MVFASRALARRYAHTYHAAAFGSGSISETSFRTPAPFRSGHGDSLQTLRVPSLALVQFTAPARSLLQLMQARRRESHRQLHWVRMAYGFQFLRRAVRTGWLPAPPHARSPASARLLLQRLQAEHGPHAKLLRTRFCAAARV